MLPESSASFFWGVYQSVNALAVRSATWAASSGRSALSMSW